ncbi:MAG: YCF48-related protein, partial [Acidobacteriota bacterium]|nr:YCF48-related protein [Acidobacteriota bacterium]
MFYKSELKVGFKKNILASLAMMLFLSVGFVFAAEETGSEPSLKSGDWAVVGPAGGDVRVVTVDPKDKNRLYISTLDGQIYTSADAGASWKLLVNLNQPRLVLDQLFVDSRDSNIIYASGNRHTDPGGFFKTTDGGATWKESKDLKKESIHAMVQSTLDPDVLLVGTIDGVWISKNSGDDWKKIQSGTMPINIDSLAIDPRTVDTMYAGTWWRPYKTTDAGKSWRLIKDGMIDDSDVFAMTIDQKNPDHVVASACSGIYESFNQGEKWAKIQGIPSQSRRTRDILQHPTMPGTVYAATTEGFWMTSNGGKSWSLTTQKDLEINSITVHPDAPNRVFIGTNNYGVMVSNDGGKNFAPASGNFTSRFTYSVTTDIERPNRIYATTQNTQTGGGFVFVSNDGGNTWQAGKNLEINRVSPFSILQDRANPNTLYLATNIGMFTSKDRGNFWTQIVAPKQPARKAVPRRRGAKTAAANSKAVATKSKTAVKPGAKITPPKTTNAVPAVANATSATALIPALTEKIKVLSYTEDGKNGIFAGTDKGLYRTYDIKKGWEKINLGDGIDGNIFVVYSTPQAPETIWVGTSISGVVVSRDNGKTWAKAGGAPDAIPISSITVDPKRPDYVYVGTSQTFYLSRNGGKSWTRRGGNLPLGNYTSILINPH